MSKTLEDKLTEFFYLLMRDELPTGSVEGLHMEAKARSIAQRFLPRKPGDVSFEREADKESVLDALKRKGRDGMKRAKLQLATGLTAESFLAVIEELKRDERIVEFKPYYYRSNTPYLDEVNATDPKLHLR